MTNRKFDITFEYDGHYYQQKTKAFYLREVGRILRVLVSEVKPTSHPCLAKLQFVHVRIGFSHACKSYVHCHQLICTLNKQSLNKLTFTIWLVTSFWIFCCQCSWKHMLQQHSHHPWTVQYRKVVVYAHKILRKERNDYISVLSGLWHENIHKNLYILHICCFVT